MVFHCTVTLVPLIFPHDPSSSASPSVVTTHWIREEPLTQGDGNQIVFLGLGPGTKGI